MKIIRFTYLIIWLLLPTWLFAQTNISTVEYWYDGDYSTANRQTVSGTSVNYADLLDVSSLKSGLHTFTIRFQDSRGVWGSLLTKFFTYYPESSSEPHFITDVEYWYDGNYVTAIETSLSSGENIDWNTLLDVSSLNYGLHTITCRFKDDRGIWNSPFIRFFKVEPGSGLKQLVALEYWFDENYAGKVSSTFDATSLLNFSEMLDVSALPIGFHFVSLRLQDEEGKWNAPTSYFFTKEAQESLPQLHQLTAQEYWFDGDYSTVQTDPISPTSFLTLNTGLDVSGLADGLHYISSRFKDESGNWSPVFSKFFSKFPAEATAEMHELVAVEYWIDGDYTSKVKTSVSSESEYILDMQLDVSSLYDGLHTVTYRFQDETGKWNPALAHFFSKYQDEIVTINNKIKRYRYWADDQIGSAIEVTLSTPLKSLELDELVDVSSLPGGTHNIIFQFQDSIGLWSSAYTESYTQGFNPRGTIAAETDPACTQSVVTFTAETLDADSIYWDFGDYTAIAGRMASENAYHAYTDAGDYIVRAILNQSSSGNSDTVYTSISIKQSYGISVVAPENLIAYYPLNGNVDDVSGLNHHGTVFEAIPTTDRNGNDNHAYYFDGVNDYIDLGDWENGGQMSFTFWARWDEFKNYGRIVDLGNGASNNNIIICNYQTGNNIFFSIYNNSSEIKYYTPAITLGNWDYFAATIDEQGEMKLYKNGAFIGNKTNAYVPKVLTRTAQYIGKSNFSGDSYFKGAIDELKVYNRALSAEEILIDYQGIGGTPLPPVVAEICDSETPYTFGTQQLSTSGTYYENFPSVTGCDSIVQLNLTVHPVYNDTIDEPLNYQINDDFENDVLGILPDGWIIRYNGTGTSDQKVVANPVKNGAQSFQVSGSGWAANLSKAVASFPDKVTLEAWLRIENVSTGGACGLSIGNPSIAQWGSFLGRVETEGGNFITYNHSGSATTKYILQPAAAGFWTHIKIEYDFSSFTYKVFINGEQASGTSGANVLTEFPLLETVPPTSVELYGNSMVYFDDVKLYESGHTAITICASETPYIFGTQQLTQSGIYTENFKSIYGCDSIVTLKLEVIPISRDTLFDAVCENALPYYWREREFVSSGIYSDTLTSFSGCDSIEFLSLEVLPVYRDTLYDAICENSIPYIWRGKAFMLSGIYYDSLTAISGCDSIKVLSLEVISVYSDTLYDSTCENSLPYVWRGKEFTATGIYSDLLTSLSGCDSIKVLSLEVIPVYSDTLYDSTCENSLPYIWRGKEFMGTGIYSDSLISNFGCDSIKVLSLEVFPVYRDTLYDAACENSLPYIWRGKEIISTGIYLDTLTSNSGCDSIKALNLEVIPAFLDTLFEETCENTLPYIWRGKEYLATGIYSDSLISINGCDSVKTLSLIVNPNYDIAISDSVYRHKLPYQFGDQILSVTGDYVDSLQTIHGCDSIIKLTFKVLIDTVPPDVICNSISVTLNSSGNYLLSENDINKLAEGTTDNANEYDELIVTVIPNSFSCSDVGENVPVKVIVNDFEGNADTCYTTVLVLDKSAPVITCTNVNITLDEDGLANIDSEKLYSSVSDACGIYSVTVNENQFSCDDIGSNRIEVRAVDNNGNSRTCYANVNVQAFVTNPSVDSIDDIQIMEDSVLDSFLISGIYDGTACMDDSLGFNLSFTNSALIESYTVDYVTGEDTAVFRLLPVQDMNGYTDITILVTNTVSGKEFSQEFGLTVLPVNDAPHSVSGLDDQKLTAGDSLILEISSEKGVLFDDVDEEDHLYLSLAQLSGEVLPDWIIFRNDSLFAYPSKADTGCYELNIIATDTEGLEATNTFNLCVDHLVGINYFAEENLKVYPNPTTGIVYIDFIAGGNDNFDISVWNVLGESVFQKSFTSGSLAEIDLSKHVSGFYYLRVSQEQSEKIFKLILTHK